MLMHGEVIESGYYTKVMAKGWSCIKKEERRSRVAFGAVERAPINYRRNAFRE